MGLTINTNVMSLNAQRNLGKSQTSLAKSMNRLSSGLRINSAKDDAAGTGYLRPYDLTDPRSQPGCTKCQ